MAELTVDNFLTKKFFNDFKAQMVKSLEMRLFIYFRCAFALIECPASGCFKSALQALIMSSSTQSIRATQTMRCRAFKRVIFYIVLVKFVKSSAFFSYSPNGSCRPNFLGCGFF